MISPNGTSSKRSAKQRGSRGLEDKLEAWMEMAPVVQTKVARTRISVVGSLGGALLPTQQRAALPSPPPLDRSTGVSIRQRRQNPCNGVSILAAGGRIPAAGVQSSSGRLDPDGGRPDPGGACKPGSGESLWQRQPMDGLRAAHVFFFFLFFLFDLRRHTK